MGFHKISGTDLSYGLIAFDVNGRERPEASGNFSRVLMDQSSAHPITDVFFFSHGWKGDVPAAVDQYNRWIGAVMKSADVARAATLFPGFRPMLIGLHWPSQPWGDEEAGGDGSFAAGGRTNTNQLLASYLDRLGDRPEIRQPLQTIIDEARYNASPDSLPASVRQAYLDLNAALELRSDGVAAPPDADREEFDPDASFEASMEEDTGDDEEEDEGDDEGAVDFGGSNLGGLLGPLRQLSFWTMKKRARLVGEGGMYEFLNELQQRTAAKGTRIHLMGHSFGTIVVSSMVNGPNGQGSLPRPIDSMVLVQGAVSLWSYARDIPFHNAGTGYYSRILSERKVRGPIVTSQSRFDTAVGKYYPLAARFGGEASFAGLPEYGAMGTYGIQGLLPEVQVDAHMLSVGDRYGFARGKVYNLESSQFIFRGDGASGAHSDIDGPEVAHAIWEAAFASTSI